MSGKAAAAVELAALLLAAGAASACSAAAACSRCASRASACGAGDCRLEVQGRQPAPLMPSPGRREVAGGRMHQHPRGPAGWQAPPTASPGRSTTMLQHAGRSCLHPGPCKPRRRPRGAGARKAQGPPPSARLRRGPANAIWHARPPPGGGAACERPRPASRTPRVGTHLLDELLHALRRLLGRPLRPGALETGQQAPAAAGGSRRPWAARVVRGQHRRHMLLTLWGAGGGAGARRDAPGQVSVGERGGSHMRALSPSQHAWGEEVSKGDSCGRNCRRRQLMRRPRCPGPSASMPHSCTSLPPGSGSHPHPR